MSTIQDLIREQMDLLNKIEVSDSDWERIEEIGHVLDIVANKSEEELHMLMEVSENQI